MKFDFAVLRSSSGIAAMHEPVNRLAETDRSSHDDQSLVGRRLGKYEILRLIGAGGMGRVYAAEDTVLRRQVAIKTLREECSLDGTQAQRFLHEAQAAARLRHPHVVTIYDVCEVDGLVLIVMELIEGGNVEETLTRDGPLPWQRAAQIITDVCRGLGAAHKSGLIHRDIKPSNIMLNVATGEADESGAAEPMPEASPSRPLPAAKLADFGLAKLREASSTTLTAAGHTAGTPHYMSPEQCRAEPLDHRSDVYALGATFYKLLTARHPFDAEQVVQILFAHCSAKIPDPCEANPTVDPRCFSIIQRAMAKQAHERFQSADEMLAALESLLAESGGDGVVERKAKPNLKPTSNGRGWIFAALSVSVALVFCAVAVTIGGVLGRWLDSSEASTTSGGTLLPGIRQNIAVGGEIGAMGVSRDQRLLAWSVSDREQTQATLTVQGLQDPQVVASAAIRRKYAGVDALAFVPGGRWIVFCNDSIVEAMSLDTGTVTRLLNLDDGSIKSLAIHPSGNRLALAVAGWSDNHRVEIYSLQFTQTTIRATSPPVGRANRDHAPRSLAYSPNGRYLASADESARVSIIEGQSGARLHEFDLPGEAVGNDRNGCSLSFSVDSRLLAVGGRRGVVVWSVSSRRRQLWPEVHRHPISVVAFSPDGSTLASASQDGIRLWHVASGEPLGKAYAAHRGNVVTNLAFCNEGRTLVSAGYDGYVRFLDVTDAIRDR